MSDGSALLPRLGLALALVVVLVVTLTFGRGGGHGDGGDDPPPAEEASPAAGGAVPGEDEFCAGYLTLADAQGQYAAQPGTAADALRAAAGDLVALGVPDSMSPLARTGYYVEISGVYGSLGDELDRSAVPGALVDDGSGASTSGSVGAFGDWLAQYCPAR
ncbi:hypothetical protein [Nocardioides sp. BYT-33-1]|uniref:hypothetical protein n=1 Tax=Nocardioides sp. BYT-33-1 TaxID=3416952 RepID=UPI003F5321AC